jgi:hypothetical protein
MPTGPVYASGSRGGAKKLVQKSRRRKPRGAPTPAELVKRAEMMYDLSKQDDLLVEPH